MNSVVIDYGLCNLLGVYKALKHPGVTAKVNHYPSELISAERPNLPGEEAFEEGMNMTKNSWWSRAVISPKHGCPSWGSACGCSSS